MNCPPLQKEELLHRFRLLCLDLYDTARLRYPMGNGKEVTTFDAFDKMVAEALTGAAGLPVVIIDKYGNLSFHQTSYCRFSG